MTGPPGDDLDLLQAAILADPAVQAAGDQLRAARAGPPPGRDPAVWAERHHAALRALVHAALRRIDAEAPGQLTPEILEALARHFEDREPPQR